MILARAVYGLLRPLALLNKQTRNAYHHAMKIEEVTRFMNLVRSRSHPPVGFSFHRLRFGAGAAAPVCFY